VEEVDLFMEKSPRNSHQTIQLIMTVCHDVIFKQPKIYIYIYIYIDHISRNERYLFESLLFFFFMDMSKIYIFESRFLLWSILLIWSRGLSSHLFFFSF
jgi:hypothetical protein